MPLARPALADQVVLDHALAGHILDCAPAVSISAASVPVAATFAWSEHSRAWDTLAQASAGGDANSPPSPSLSLSATTDHTLDLTPAHTDVSLPGSSSSVDFPPPATPRDRSLSQSRVRVVDVDVDVAGTATEVDTVPSHHDGAKGADGFPSEHDAPLYFGTGKTRVPRREADITLGSVPASVSEHSSEPAPASAPVLGSEARHDPALAVLGSRALVAAALFDRVLGADPTSDSSTATAPATADTDANTKDEEPPHYLDALILNHQRRRRLRAHSVSSSLHTTDSWLSGDSSLYTPAVRDIDVMDLMRRDLTHLGKGLGPPKPKETAEAGEVQWVDFRAAGAGYVAWKWLQRAGWSTLLQLSRYHQMSWDGVDHMQI